MTSHIAYIGIGSNLYNPVRQINNVLALLDNIRLTTVISQSPFYISTAVGGPSNQPDYINAVIMIKTALNPKQLLLELQTLELVQHRKRYVHWGPRTIDLDILLYDKQVINTTSLTIPHPRLYERAFVLIPLGNIAPPDLIISGYGSLKKLLEQCEKQQIKCYNTPNRN